VGAEDVGHSQADKIATHQRIVDAAAKRFREQGLDGISIADLMKDAGLTVGGFYRHFASRDELIAEAFEHALRDVEPWEAAMVTSPRQAMRMYLSDSHRDEVSNSCPVSTLVNDMSRSTDDARAAYTARVKRMAELIAKAIPTEDSADKRAEAHLIMSACVGAVALSRAVTDPKLSKQILDGALSQILELLSPKRAAK
jgi:TetR/AcrR family transcriptional repressor of nem operon